MSPSGAGWEAEAERLGRELGETKQALTAMEARAVAGEKRASEAEAQAAVEKQRREETDRRANDHPNTSWGALYADRDRWRRAFLDAATLASIDGVSLIQWRARALQLDARIVEIVKLAGVPLATEAAFVPHEMPPRLLHDVQLARKEEAALAEKNAREAEAKRVAELEEEVKRRVAAELQRLAEAGPALAPTG